MSAIYATVAQDNHGPYILFGAGESRVYRPQASSLSPGKNIYAFNKVREAAERTEFLVDTDYTVSPVKYATDFEHERYIMVYTPKRRELWCSHGSPSGGGWTPLSSTTVEEVKATEEKVSGTKNVLSKAPRLMAWMIRKGVLK